MGPRLSRRLPHRWAPRSSQRHRVIAGISPGGRPDRRWPPARSGSRRMRPTCSTRATAASTSRSTSSSRTSSRTPRRRSSTTRATFRDPARRGRSAASTDASGALSVTTKERRFFTAAQVNLRNFLYYQPVDQFTSATTSSAAHRAPKSPVRVEPGVRDVRRLGVGRPGRSTVEVRMPARLRDRGRRGRPWTDNDGRRPDPHRRARATRTRSTRSSAPRTARPTASTRISLDGDVELVVLAWPEDDAGRRRSARRSGRAAGAASSSSGSPGRSTTT